MSKHPLQDLLPIHAEQQVSKRARVSHTKTFWESVSDFTLPYPCDLSTLEIVVTGKTKAGDKVLIPIALHACTSTPLNGPHLVSICGSCPFWVQSLTAFKKHFFGIEDKLSFERAFYVKDLHGQMVRLQNIRFIATLPRQEMDMEKDVVYRTPQHTIPAGKCLMHPTRMRTLTQIRRRQSLTSQLLSRLLFVYKVEFPDPDECIRQVQEAVEQECTKLKAGLHAYQALFETVCEAQNEEDSDTMDKESYAA